MYSDVAGLAEVHGKGNVGVIHNDKAYLDPLTVDDGRKKDRGITPKGGLQ